MWIPNRGGQAFIQYAHGADALDGPARGTEEYRKLEEQTAAPNAPAALPKVPKKNKAAVGNGRPLNELRPHVGAPRDFQNSRRPPAPAPRVEPRGTMPLCGRAAVQTTLDSNPNPPIGNGMFDSQLWAMAAQECTKLPTCTRPANHSGRCDGSKGQLVVDPTCAARARRVCSLSAKCEASRSSRALGSRGPGMHSF